MGHRVAEDSTLGTSATRSKNKTRLGLFIYNLLGSVNQISPGPLLLSKDQSSSAGSNASFSLASTAESKPSPDSKPDKSAVQQGHVAPEEQNSRAEEWALELVCPDSQCKQSGTGEGFNDELKQESRVPQEVNGSHGWICSRKEFEAWRDRSDVNLLLLSVEPWYVESDLARYLAEIALPCEWPQASIYRLFGWGGDLQNRKNKTAEALSTIIYEHFSKDGMPLNDTSEIQPVNNGFTTDTATLWKLFDEEFERQGGEIICVLETLDDSDHNTVRTLMQDLKSCITKSRNRGVLKFLMTTRRHLDVSHVFEGFSPHYTQLSWGVETELQKYRVTAVNEKLKMLNIRGDYNRIRRALHLDGWDQTSYVWAKIVFDVLRDLSRGSFETDLWSQLIGGSSQKSFTLLKKLLEPAPTSSTSTSRKYPSYCTVERLLRVHFQSLLEVRPRKKFQWVRKQDQMFKGEAYSDDGPSLAVVEDKLYAVWRGAWGNNGLWWAKIEKIDETWTKPKAIRGAKTNARPSIAAMGKALVAMWKGPEGDEGLYYSVLKSGNDEWSEPQKTEFGSKAGPALALLEENIVWAAWRGTEGDDLFWRTTFNGEGEKFQHQYPVYIDISTDTRPALASCHGRLYLAWSSSAPETAQQIWISSLETDTDLWEQPFCVEPHCHSSAAPSLAKFGDTLIVSWRGKGNDRGIWLASGVHPGDFERPQRLENAATDCTPALAEWKRKVVLVWKGGMFHDHSLWWGYGELS